MADTSSIVVVDRPFPLMKLPTELRLRIYGFAFQHIVNDITSKPRSEDALDDHQQYRGALGLLHTDHALRHESRDALRLLIKAHLEEIAARESQSLDSLCNHRTEECTRMNQILAQAPLGETRMQSHIWLQGPERYTGLRAEN